KRGTKRARLVRCFQMGPRVRKGDEELPKRVLHLHHIEWYLKRISRGGAAKKRCGASIDAVILAEARWPISAVILAEARWPISAVILAEARNQTRTTRALLSNGSSRPHTGVRGKSDISRPGFRRKRLMERDYGISLAENAENAEKSQQDDARSAGAWSRRESRTISVPLFFVRSPRSPRSPREIP